MKAHDLPDVSLLCARLATDNARVAAWAQRHPGRADALLDAVRTSDWGEIGRLSELLARCDEPHDTIRYRALRVCEELRKPDNLRGVKRSVMRLIGACGERAEHGG